MFYMETNSRMIIISHYWNDSHTQVELTKKSFNKLHSV